MDGPFQQWTGGCSEHLRRFIADRGDIAASKGLTGSLENAIKNAARKPTAF
jgi:hypothetical protein